MINEVIQKSTMELIKDRIVLIITNELTNQLALTASSTDPDEIAYREQLLTFWNSKSVLNIFRDRFQTLQPEEYNAIIVNVVQERDENGSNALTKPESEFAIDFLVRAKSEDGKRGDLKSNEILQRISSTVRMVFLTAIYMRLGFDTKFIRRQNVLSRKFYVPESNDSDHISGVTLTLQVDYEESIIQSTPVILKGNDSKLADRFTITTDTED